MRVGIISEYLLFTALQFSQTLVQFDTAQEKISTHLTAHADMQKQVSFDCCSDAPQKNLLVPY